MVDHGCQQDCEQGRRSDRCRFPCPHHRDEDDALADADYEAWGPLWWQVVERHPALLAVVCAALGCIPFFWRTA